MRTRTRATWIGSALAITLSAAAHLSGVAAAEPKSPKKPPPDVNVGECVDFEQTQDDGGIDFALRSTCPADLDCSVSWALRCDGDPADKKRQEARAFVLPAGRSGGAYASADACGDKGWSIGKVRWSCRNAE